MHCTQNPKGEARGIEYNAYQPAGCNFNASQGLMQQRYCHMVYYTTKEFFEKTMYFYSQKLHKKPNFREIT